MRNKCYHILISPLLIGRDDNTLFSSGYKRNELLKRQRVKLQTIKKLPPKEEAHL